jgi:hypothetical protein
MNKITKFHVKNKLRQARATIANKGWTQGTWDNIDGCACTLGAIRLACKIIAPYGQPTKIEYNQQDYDLAMRTEDHFKQVTGINNIIDWNDDPNTTRAEVLAAFDKAIAA